MGAWIETLLGYINKNTHTVAPYVGAWIETYDTIDEDVDNKSHPTWVRGLKLSVFGVNIYPQFRRTLRGCVD